MRDHLQHPGHRHLHVWCARRALAAGGILAETQTAGLIVAGVASLSGSRLEPCFPIVRFLVQLLFLFAGGWSLLLLALFYGIIDILGYRKWPSFSL